MPRWNVKHIAGLHFDYGSIPHRGGSPSANHQADMFDLAKGGAGFRPDVPCRQTCSLLWKDQAFGFPLA